MRKVIGLPIRQQPTTVRWSSYWKSVYEPLAHRIGKQKAITVIARELLVTIWYILSKREVDRYGAPQAIARSMMSWASSYRLARRHGSFRPEFIKQRLSQLGILKLVPSFKDSGHTYHLLKAT